MLASGTPGSGASTATTGQSASTAATGAKSREAWPQERFDRTRKPYATDLSQPDAELTDVLGRPAADGRAEAYIAALAGDALQIDDPPDPPSVSPDAGDDYLFALGLAASADVVVSGDSHLTELADPTTPVLTPRQFTDQLD